MNRGSINKEAMMYESGIRYQLPAKLYWQKSPYRIVLDAFLQRQYTLCLSYEIILEYEEKFTEFWGAEVSTNLVRRLLAGVNTSLYTIYYYFQLISGDPDDNKFSDTYLVANADFLVLNDRLVLALRNKTYPKVNVITVQEFAELILTQPES